MRIRSSVGTTECCGSRMLRAGVGRSASSFELVNVSVAATRPEGECRAGLELADGWRLQSQVHFSSLALRPKMSTKTLMTRTMTSSTSAAAKALFGWFKSPVGALSKT